MSRDTDLQREYVAELCIQAGIGRVTEHRNEIRRECNGAIAPHQYQSLMATGFNHIDLRCDRFLAWLDQSRVQSTVFRGSLNSVQSIVNTALNIGGAANDTMGYVAQAFGLLGVFQNAYYADALMSLEASTIRTIVYERRLAHRRAALQAGVNTREGMINELQNYLRICTPQDIMQNVNEYSRGVATGNPTNVDADVRELVQASTPLHSGSASTEANPYIAAPNTESCAADLARMFVDTSERSCDDIEFAQIRLCTRPDRDVGRVTESAIRVYESMLLANQAATNSVVPDGQLNEVEWNALANEGCLPDSWPQYQNYYEFGILTPNSEFLIWLSDYLDTTYPEVDENSAADGTASDAFRDRLQQAARDLGIGGPAVQYRQLTDLLYDALIDEFRATQNQ